MDTDLRSRIMAEVPCSWCNQAAGRNCMTAAGRKMFRPHHRRINAWWRMQQEIHGPDYMRAAIRY